MKLNTAVKSFGRVKGWNATSDLDNTVRTAKRNPAEAAAVIEAINAALPAARAKLNAEVALINSGKAIRGTRSGRAIGARYDRAYHKVHALESALRELSAVAA